MPPRPAASTLDGPRVDAVQRRRDTAAERLQGMREEAMAFAIRKCRHIDSSLGWPSSNRLAQVPKTWRLSPAGG